MMNNTYALIENGLVTNVVVWNGDTANWQPPDGVEVVEIEEGATVGIGYSYADGVFAAPTAPPPPIPTAAEVLAQCDALLAMATLRIAPLQDAVDLDDTTAAETAALKAWKQYRVALSRIEQQAGFPAAVEWPQLPA